MAELRTKKYQCFFKCDLCGTRSSSDGDRRGLIQDLESEGWVIDYPTWAHVVAGKMCAVCPKCIKESEARGEGVKNVR